MDLFEDGGGVAVRHIYTHSSSTKNIQVCQQFVLPDGLHMCKCRPLFFAGCDLWETILNFGIWRYHFLEICSYVRRGATLSVCLCSARCVALAVGLPLVLEYSLYPVANFLFRLQFFLQSVNELLEFMETWGFAISFATCQPAVQSLSTGFCVRSMFSSLAKTQGD